MPKSILEILLLSIALAAPALALPFQQPAAEDPPPPPRVRVPIYPNVACPIMAKPISTRLFVDTELGRFWVCCKGCDEDILAHVEDAHRTAYPVVKRVDNKICPVSGEPIPKEDAPRLVLQGFDFALCCKACIPKARADSQVVLARLNEPQLVDLGNRTCPVSGEPVDPRTFVVIDATIVRLAQPRSVAAVEERPDAILAKARQIRAQELEAERLERERAESERARQGGESDGAR